MMLFYYLLIPLVVAFIAPLFRPRLATILSFLSFIIPFIAIMTELLLRGTSKLYILSFPAPVGDFYLFSDPVSDAFGLSIALVSAIVALYSLPYMIHRFKEMELSEEKEYRKYIFIYNIYAASMLWLVYSGNFILLFIFLEISLLASFFLIYMYGYGNRRWVAMLYFIWTHVAGALTFVGFLVMAFDNSTLALESISSISYIAWLLIFTGMIVKLPGLGPHIWLPWAHAEAPTTVSALLSPLTVGLAGYILIRIYLIDGWFINEFRNIIMTYAIITSIYAGFSVLRQRDYKKLLAYSTVSQMGYMLIGLCLGGYGVTGATIQYISHAFGKSILFMTAGGLIVAYHGLRDLGKMSGMHEYVPTISNAALLGFMNLSGIIAIGMFGEFFILKGIIDVYSFNIPVIISVVFVFILSGWYSFYTMKNIYYGKPAEYEKVKVNRLIDTPLYVIGALSILFIFPPLITALVDGLRIITGGVLP